MIEKMKMNKADGDGEQIWRNYRGMEKGKKVA